MNTQDTTLNEVIAGMAVEEQSMAERYLRSPRQWQETVYEFTRDPGYLHQYYRLRENVAPSLWGLVHAGFNGDEYDRNSHILVARRGNQVIAGCRLTLSTPRKPQSLPMEEGGISIAGLLGELGLGHKKYAELSGVAVDFADEHERYLPSMLYHVVRKLTANRVHYLMGRVALSQAQAYRRNLASLGLRMELKTGMDLPFAQEEETKSYLMVVKMNPHEVTFQPQGTANATRSKDADAW